MIVSGSDLKLWDECPRKGAFKLAFNLWTPPTEAMAYGTLAHQALHYHLWPRASAPTTPRPPEPACPPELTDGEYNELMAAAAAFTYPPNTNLLDLELAARRRFSCALEVVGRLDASLGDADYPPRVLDGLAVRFWWSGQHKTISRANVALELERVRLSPAELLYHWLLRDSGVHALGTAVTLLRVAKRTVAGRTRRSVAIHDTVLAGRSSEEAAANFTSGVLPTLQAVGAFAERCRPATNPADLATVVAGVPANLRACFGPFGAGPVCPLYSVCHHHHVGGLPDALLSITDTGGFVPASTINRYPEFQPGA